MTHPMGGGSTERRWGVSKNGPAEGVIKRQKSGLSVDQF
jgi:hypothetical protein